MNTMPAPKADALPGCATPRLRDALSFHPLGSASGTLFRGNARRNTAGTGQTSPGIVPDQPVPWEIGHSRADYAVEVANREYKSFSVDVEGERWVVSIGGRAIGLLYPETFDLIQWPEIVFEWSEENFVAMLHDRADEFPGRALCYFVGGDEGPVKIGFSIDVASRLRAMQACSPVVLRVLATRTGGEMRESAYHRQFSDHRLHGEWFTRCPEIEAEITHLSPIDPLNVEEGL
jgi:hypothetical protein